MIVDCAGNRPLALLRRVLAPRGRLVIVGAEGAGRWFGLGRQARAVFMSPMVRQRLGTFVAVTRRADLLALTALTDSGKLTPVIDRTYPLEEAAAAIDRLRNGHPLGKVVLSIPPGS